LYIGLILLQKRVYILISEEVITEMAVKKAPAPKSAKKPATPAKKTGKK
jgi:hypothetical protein